MKTSLAVVAFLAAIGYGYGWQPAALAFVAVLGAYLVGWDSLTRTLASEGYKVENRADGRGKRRWRVGLVRAKAAEDVEWIAPSGGRSVDSGNMSAFPRAKADPDVGEFGTG